MPRIRPALQSSQISNNEALHVERKLDAQGWSRQYGGVPCEHFSCENVIVNREALNLRSG